MDTKGSAVNFEQGPKNLSYTTVNTPLQVSRQDLRICLYFRKNEVVINTQMLQVQG